MDVETGVFHSMGPRLFDLLREMHGQPKNIRIDLSYIHNELAMVSAVLENESRRVRSDEQEHVWSDQQEQQFKHMVREFSYDIETFIDKSRLILNPPLEGFKGLMEKMGGFIIKKGKTPHQIFASELKRMKAKVETILRLRGSFRFGSVDRPAALQDLYPQVKDLVGIDGKKDEELIKLLSDGDNASNKKLKIISVVGHGGLGKTTLVNEVYAKIGGGFDCKAFVVAGHSAEVKKVLMDIISQHTMDDSSYSSACTLNEQELIEELRKILENKRYLIVIDDIWDENLGEIVKDAFSTNDNNLGSRVIIMTRIVNVSKACCSFGNDSIYQMKPLSDDDSKKLLYAEIFGSPSKCPPEFEQVSIDILNKCGGVPIAIITMASVLAGYPQMQTWHDLLKSSGYEFAEECWENMKIIISFSYNGLPSCLKTCLVYTSIFPEGHPIERDRLVKKWIAEGIVSHGSNQNESSYLDLEAQAGRHFNKLIQMNAIHPLECNNNGEVITYHIRPMMHVFLKAIAIKEKFAASLDIKHISRAHRMNFPNLFIHCPDSEILTDLSSQLARSIRSLTISGHANRIILRHFKDIRVLDLEGCMSIERADLEYICSMVLLRWLCLAKTLITELPPQIGSLQLLEGLDVGGTQITQLPPQIGKLKRLRTLDARKTRVQEIPAQVLHLTGLVQLLIGDNESSEGVMLPDGIGKMTSLQRLCTIDLRRCSECSLKELGELQNLKSIAVVSGDKPKDTRMNDALLSSINKSTTFSGIDTVVYSDFRLSNPQTSSVHKYLHCRKKVAVSGSLKVPIFLKGQSFLSMLDITVCKLEEDDLKILGGLPRLQSLIVRLKVLSTEMVHISCEGFAKLESLYVDCRMPRVIFEEGAMPELEHLELKLHGGTASEEHMGIKHLLNLRKVTLRYAKWYATNMGIRETTEAMKTECKDHQNEITLCIAEEGKNGICNTKTAEVFQENRVASCSKMAETEKEEEEEETQEGGLHQSSHDIASCSGISEIKEVVE